MEMFRILFLKSLIFSVNESDLLVMTENQLYCKVTREYIDKELDNSIVTDDTETYDDAIWCQDDIESVHRAQNNCRDCSLLQKRKKEVTNERSYK